MELWQEEGHERAARVKAKLTCEGTLVVFLTCEHAASLNTITSHREPLPAARCSLALPGGATGDSPQGIVTGEGAKGKGFDFHSLGLFSPPSSPACPLPFHHIVLSLNQTFTKGIRGRLLINSKAGWKRGNQPWRSAEGHSCSGGPGGSKSPG